MASFFAGLFVGCVFAAALCRFFCRPRYVPLAALKAVKTRYRRYGRRRFRRFNFNRRHSPSRYKMERIFQRLSDSVLTADDL